MRFQLEAPAKINPFLEILGPRPDGYHNVQFVMQTVALSDTLTLTPQGAGRAIDFTCSDPTLQTPDNLVVKAYQLFYDGYPQLKPLNVQLTLEKNIPLQAGLGGGSSDAAAMLRLLNHLHNKPLSKAQLAELAAQLGSDVPFFLTGGTCQAQGRGEIIAPLPPAYAHQSVLLLKPLAWGISTPQAYQYIKDLAYTPQPFSDTTLFNRFESVLFPHFPLLEAIKEALTYHIGAHCLLSGSGPTFFVLLDTPLTPQSWQAFCAIFPDQSWWSHTTTTSAELPCIHVT